MNRFYNALAAMAVILTPVAMIASLGWTAYTAVLSETGAAWLAVLAGIATAAALECVGIVAGETALWFHARRDSRWIIAAAVLLIYVAAGLFILQATALFLLPLLAGAVYVLVGLRAQAQRETAAESDRAGDDARAAAIAAESGRQWEMEQWRIRQADKTRVRLAEVELSASTVLAQPAYAGTMPSPNGTKPPHRAYECEDCGRSFATVQAANAHKRFCAGVDRTNGSGV